MCVCVVGFILFLLAVAVSMATDSCDPRSSSVGHLNAGTQDDGTTLSWDMQSEEKGQESWGKTAVALKTTTWL